MTASRSWVQRSAANVSWIAAFGGERTQSKNKV
jgi:hypothetical protein